MRKFLAILSAFVLAACASQATTRPTSSLGQQLSSNLLKVHEMYCIGSPQANQRLAELKLMNRSYQVVDRKTGEKSIVWVVVPPKIEEIGGQTLVKWGFSVRELATGGNCGVAYLQPEGLDALKSGYLP